MWLSDLAVDQRAERVLVAGCGAGLLPLRLARGGASVTAVDMNPHAVTCCLHNAYANGVHDRINGIVADMRELDGRGEYDLVVCNPPQLPASADPRPADWVALANDGGRDGRSLIDWLCEDGTRLVSAGGALMFTHFTFLDVERTVAALRAQGMRVTVSEPLHKPLGRLSGERLPRLTEWREGDHYSVVIITARKLGI
ncbi:methyltransferase [Streptantibioticus silvisoli]|uniref:Methyltransferase n=1 Tax=Streptantibioticus silvisoli TaxID=2705255 RepID=A0ABT6W7W4_9ACTN|nr:methyltransferase [Streptantibioticus silvisoli]MDI5966840.1 methyltransferase [Streptantibioticus silvisoli]